MVATLKQNASHIEGQLAEWSKWQTAIVKGTLEKVEEKLTISPETELGILWDQLDLGPRITETILTLPMRSRKNETLAEIFGRDKKSDLWTLHSAVTQHFTDQDSELVRIRELPKVEKVFMKYAAQVH